MASANLAAPLHAAYADRFGLSSLVLTRVFAAVAIGIGHGLSFLGAQDELNGIAPAERRGEVTSAFVCCISTPRSGASVILSGAARAVDLAVGRRRDRGRRAGRARRDGVGLAGQARWAQGPMPGRAPA